MSATPSLLRVVVSTSHLPRALALYEAVLGLTVTSRQGGLARLAAAGGVEVLLHERPAVPSDTAVAAGFVVTGLDDVVRRWSDAGGTVPEPPADQPWGERMAVVRDTDGHLLCLIAAE